VEALRAVVVADGRGFGGAQVYARSLVRHAPPDWAVDVVTTAEHAPHLAPDAEARGGRVVVVPTTVREPEAPALREAVARLAPDLVQVNLVDPSSMLAALEACTDAAPTVATLHMRGEVPDPARARAAYAALHHVVAVSAEFAAVAREALGVPAERLTHVVNGVDPLPVVRPAARPVPVVGALGRLSDGHRVGGRGAAAAAHLGPGRDGALAGRGSARAQALPVRRRPPHRPRARPGAGSRRRADLARG
jgi:hypothetical protein